MVKSPPTNVGDSVPNPERSPGEGNSNPLHYSCLGSLMDRETCRATVQGVSKGPTGLTIEEQT